MSGETRDSIISSPVVSHLILLLGNLYKAVKALMGNRKCRRQSRTWVNLTLIDNNTEMIMFAVGGQKFTLEALNN